jgi:hypothetical protein
MPADITLYKLLTDLGGFIAAIAALIAAIIAYNGIWAQITEAQDENREQRKVERRREKQEKLVAASLVGAALEVFSFDVSHVRNIFDPGKGDPDFDNRTIEPERAQWLRQQLRPLTFGSMLPYLGRLDHELAKEYLFLISIGQRIRDDSRPLTYGQLRELLETVRPRIDHFQGDIRRQAEPSEDKS